MRVKQTKVKQHRQVGAEPCMARRKACRLVGETSLRMNTIHHGAEILTLASLPGFAAWDFSQVLHKKPQYFFLSLTGIEPVRSVTSLP